MLLQSQWLFLEFGARCNIFTRQTGPWSPLQHVDLPGKADIFPSEPSNAAGRELYNLHDLSHSVAYRSWTTNLTTARSEHDLHDLRDLHDLHALRDVHDLRTSCCRAWAVRSASSSTRLLFYYLLFVYTSCTKSHNGRIVAINTNINININTSSISSIHLIHLPDVCNVGHVGHRTRYRASSSCDEPSQHWKGSLRPYVGWPSNTATVSRIHRAKTGRLDYILMIV